MSDSSLASRVRALLPAPRSDVRAGFVALLVSSGGDLLAGLTLGAITGTLEQLPGLVILVPAAIGMRGNIFGALGNRLGTVIHTGQFEHVRRPASVVRQNIAAAVALSLAVSLVDALLAKTIAAAFGEPTMSVIDFMVVSVLGGALSSAVVLVVTVVVALAAARYQWDLDNVAAPVVTAAGDIVTLPSLWLATHLLGLRWLTPAVAGVCAMAAVAAAVAGLRSRRQVLRRIVRESLPMLVFAGIVDILAGVTVDRRLESFLAYPALLVLIPPFLEDSGALGSILSARVSTRLHLGTLEPSGAPLVGAGPDVVLVYGYALPVFLLVGASSHVAARVIGLPSPGLATMIAVALVAGLLATTCAVFVAYYTAVFSQRLGLDPDNHGVPMVTSSLDLLGAFCLVLTLMAFGLT